MMYSARTEDHLETQTSSHRGPRAVQAKNVLSLLVSRLATAPADETLRTIVRECVDAVDDCIEASREDEPNHRPASAAELVILVEQLSFVQSRESLPILRQLRRMLGDLDVGLR
jgi:hypothetical protein